ncbi:MAG: hypothetical protein FWE02_07490 [Defluviitaleaceae bacterium]|nr:hypothetical protein [Defluviitaleaceae bacterium]
MNSAIIVSVLICVYLLFKMFTIATGAYKITVSTVMAFCGGLGTGKTLVGVNYVVKLHRRGLRKVKRYNFFQKVRHPIKKAKRKHKDEPLIYSSIPIDSRYYVPLHRNHVLKKWRQREYSVTFIDEIGQVASQWDFDNPNVKYILQEYIRLYRHYLDGYFICTDQSPDNIVVYVRRRINLIYNFNRFKKQFLFLNRFFTTEVTPIESVEGVSNVNLTNKGEEKKYLFAWLPIRKLYDSRCYSQLYDEVPECNTDDSKPFRPKTLKANHFVDLKPTDEELEYFKEVYGYKVPSTKGKKY